ncbi:MAG: hypothetical protein EA351_07280 [Gemmatimonadales bacterium]|nr:MAG: hypothetical protein EA351_07280 [Gemmatimonadales bacterium]
MTGTHEDPGLTGDREARAEPAGMSGVSRETLMRYIDGELSPAERAEVDAVLARSTELERELALYRSLHEDLSGIQLPGPDPRRSIWGAVNRRLARPMGWIFLTVGVLAWFSHVTFVYFTSPAPSWEKLATSAVGIGVLLLFATVIHDRYREWLNDPYNDIER